MKLSRGFETFLIALCALEIHVMNSMLVYADLGHFAVLVLVSLRVLCARCVSKRLSLQVACDIGSPW